MNHWSFASILAEYRAFLPDEKVWAEGEIGKPDKGRERIADIEVRLELGRDETDGLTVSFTSCSSLTGSRSRGSPMIHGIVQIGSSDHILIVSDAASILTSGTTAPRWIISAL